MLASSAAGENCSSSPLSSSRQALLCLAPARRGTHASSVRARIKFREELFSCQAHGTEPPRLSFTSHPRLGGQSSCIKRRKTSNAHLDHALNFVESARVVAFVAHPRRFPARRLFTSNDSAESLHIISCGAILESRAQSSASASVFWLAFSRGTLVECPYQTPRV
jgi:hypothetical protein